MSEAPYMPFFVGDYIRDTRMLTFEQHGAYVLLLTNLWTEGGWLPNDHAKLARCIGATRKQWLRIWPEISRFFTVEDDHITQKRLLLERQKASEKSRKRQEAGKLGGEAKALKTQEADVANATPNAKQMPQQNGCHSPYPGKEVVDVGTSTTVRKSTRGSRISPDWQAREQERQWARDHGWAETEIEDAEDRFRDYWLTRTGQGATKTDWDRTFLNRLKDLNDRRPPIRGSPRNRSQTADPMMQEFKRRFEQDDDEATGQSEIEAPGGIVRRLPATGTRGH